jgi:phosphoserine phosphatase
MTHRLPLAVDMDGCLLATDMLMEALAAALIERPLLALAAPLWLARGGRPLLKRKLAQADLVDVAHLPLREDFIACLRAQQAKGRALHLVSASDQAAADAVAARLALFDSATGSDGRTNLKAGAKRAFLQAQFPNGFVYAGDSRADLNVWPAAAAAIASGAKPGVIAALVRMGVPLEATFPPSPATPKDWAQLIGARRWGWALIGLAALPSAGLFVSVALTTSLVAALAVGHVIAALVRLKADRHDPLRRARPLAAGRIGLAAALNLAWALPAFAIGLLAAALTAL